MKKLIAALGALTLAGAVGAQGFDAMGMADADHDGKVSAAEFATFRETGWGYFAQGADSVKLADLPEMAANAFKGMTPDANGAVTHAAYTAATAKVFAAADKNGDGALDAAELTPVV